MSRQLVCAQPPTTIEFLPPELLLRIFYAFLINKHGYLNCRNISRITTLRLVCRTWDTVVSRECGFWYSLELDLPMRRVRNGSVEGFVSCFFARARPATGDISLDTVAPPTDDVSQDTLDLPTDNTSLDARAASVTDDTPLDILAGPIGDTSLPTLAPPPLRLSIDFRFYRKHPKRHSLQRGSHEANVYLRTHQTQMNQLVTYFRTASPQSGLKTLRFVNIDKSTIQWVREIVDNMNKAVHRGATRVWSGLEEFRVAFYKDAGLGPLDLGTPILSMKSLKVLSLPGLCTTSIISQRTLARIPPDHPPQARRIAEYGISFASATLGSHARLQDLRIRGYVNPKDMKVALGLLQNLRKLTMEQAMVSATRLLQPLSDFFYPESPRTDGAVSPPIESPVSTLVISGPEGVPSIVQAGLRFPKLESLTICNLFALDDGPSGATFLKFIASLPALVTLDLRHSQLNGKDQWRVIQSIRSKSFKRLVVPTLYFLGYIEQWEEARVMKYIREIISVLDLGLKYRDMYRLLKPRREIGRVTKLNLVIEGDSDFLKAGSTSRMLHMLGFLDVKLLKGNGSFRPCRGQWISQAEFQYLQMCCCVL